MRSHIAKLLLSALLFFFIFLGSVCKNDKPCTTCPTPDDTTANPRRLIDNAGYPDWSPTGERMAFVRDSLIYLYYFSDKHIEAVTVGTEPNFSPDGGKLTFERDRKIYWIDLTSKQEVYLADGITPNWSANGKWIAFANKSASRLLTDGTIIYGAPSTDSSLYYYDFESSLVKRIVITNYDSLYIGAKLSIFSPVWAMHDSILFFSVEFGLLKVKNSGGLAVGYPLDFPKSKTVNKRYSIASIGNGGQQRWNEVTRRLIYFANDEIGDHVYQARVHMHDFKTGFGGAIMQRESTDPTWSTDGKKIGFTYISSVWVYQLLQ